MDLRHCACGLSLIETKVVSRSPLIRPTRFTSEFPTAPYSLLNMASTRLRSSPSMIWASPSYHAPIGFPDLSDVAMRTCGFRRIRLTFQVSGPVRK